MLLFPTSDNNYKCIGPCYEKNTNIIHPTKLIHVNNKKFSFCPINDDKLIDVCSKPTHNEDICNYIYIEYNKLTHKQFLDIHYKINSFNDVVQYYNKNSNIASLNTLQRIINYAIIAFKDHVEFFINIIIDFMNRIIKKKWINYFYSYLKYYIYIDDNGNITTNVKKNIDFDEQLYEEKIKNYIITVILNEKTIYNFVHYYLINLKKNEQHVLRDQYIFDIYVNFAKFINRNLYITVLNEI
jgi:hypothetical protein